MQFAQPIWIFIGLLVCLSLFFIFRLLRKRRQIALQNFAARTLLGKLTANVSERKRTLKNALLLAAVFCCFLALARPQYGHHWVEVKRKGIDILFAIDTSLSMGVEDIQPNRLERSKFAILDFINQLEGDRVGLMPFAGSAFLMCPLTVDYNAFEQSLQSVDVGIIPEPGTNLAEAIRSAETILHNDANHKLLIIVTDGENLQGDAVEAAARAAAQGMTIFTVGVGTPQGELIPHYQDGRQTFIKDSSGNFVISRLDEKSLRTIAEKTGGVYAPLGNKGQGLATIYQQKLALIPKMELAEKRHRIPIDRFPWFLGIALFLLIAEYLLNSRKTETPSFNLRKIFQWKNRAFFVLLMLLGLLHPPPEAVSSPADEAYIEKKYQKAAEYYQEALEKTPDNAILHYNLGTASYKSRSYDEAISSFNLALQSDDLALQNKSYYNLGNAHFRKGEALQYTNPQKTKEHWQDALTAYSSSLQLNPENEEARFNHDFVEKKLRELENRENQQQSKPENNKKDQQDNQSEDQGQNQAQQNKEQQKSADTNAQPDQKDNEQQEPRNPTGQDESKPSDTRQSQQHRPMSPEKMSREEAEQLLREMRNEEGTLNFLPKTANEKDMPSGRNW